MGHLVSEEQYKHVNKHEYIGTYIANDQCAKADNGKARVSLVPRAMIWAVARIRGFGVMKYKDPDNWKGIEKERYRDAMMRHMLAYLDDPKGVDEESGYPHLWHCMCNGAFLCELEGFKDSDYPVRRD